MLFVAPYEYARADDRVDIWMKAFIPNTHPTNPDLIAPVPNHPGRWMLKGPLSSSDCFATDDRTFSADKSASARATTYFSLITDGKSVQIQPNDPSQVHTSGMSVKMKCENGSVIDQRLGVFETRAIGAPHIADGNAQVIGESSIKNPFTPVGSPYIDYSFNYVFDYKDGTLSYKLTIGAFPSFEAYASINGSPPQAILRRKASGKTPFSLYDMGLGFNTEQYNGIIKLRDPIIPDLNGVWSGSCHWSSVTDPTTLTFSGKNHDYSVKYVSLSNNSDDTASINIGNDRHVQFKLFGIQYNDDFSPFYNTFTMQSSLVTCNYSR